VKAPLSIRARLVGGAFLVLLAFLAFAGWAVQQAYADSLRTQRFARLQTTVYLLMAGAELDGAGGLVMPPSLAEPRLSLLGSGLYANVINLDKNEEWQSASTVGLNLPFQRSQATGQWRLETVAASNTHVDTSKTGRAFLAATYAVKWSTNNKEAPLVFSVLEDKAEFDQQLAAFGRTLWSWLIGTGLLLLLTQTMLLRWGLRPLGQVEGNPAH
jgi:two-component system sensor histidine kinase PhoQ